MERGVKLPLLSFAEDGCFGRSPVLGLNGRSMLLSHTSAVCHMQSLVFGFKKVTKPNCIDISVYTKNTISML